ncbi:SLATT domain-containing protein [Mumia sp. zg.B53]|uniref:SLATT domain-containing protein n=1 Tax=unclassified Mumia TaxID=2621872 RepID=UPI001C6E33EA|nr:MULTISPECIES: SLATT domain-containing protein [unclassified Mumia]MBW9215695.1 SLATT domain-containing protein [Mumia sp. zg.B53]MDD9349330.1 SLATT domain-containing protein [Mumia sp.]
MWTYRGDEPTVIQWLGSIRLGHEAHRIAAKAVRRRHRALALVTVLVAVLAAAAAFTAALGTSRTWLQVSAGTLAALAAATALLHAVADDADVIAAHQRAAAEYGDLRRQLEQAILSERITDDRLAEIRHEWTRIEERAPSLSHRTTRRADDQLRPGAHLPVPASATDAPHGGVPQTEIDDEPVKELTAG